MGFICILAETLVLVVQGFDFRVSAGGRHSVLGFLQPSCWTSKKANVVAPRSAVYYPQYHTSDDLLEHLDQEQIELQARPPPPPRARDRLPHAHASRG